MFKVIEVYKKSPGVFVAAYTDFDSIDNRKALIRCIADYAMSKGAKKYDALKEAVRWCALFGIFIKDNKTAPLMAIFSMMSCLSFNDGSQQGSSMKAVQ